MIHAKLRTVWDYSQSPSFHFKQLNFQKDHGMQTLQTEIECRLLLFKILLDRLIWNYLLFLLSLSSTELDPRGEGLMVTPHQTPSSNFQCEAGGEEEWSFREDYFLLSHATSNRCSRGFCWSSKNSYQR